MSRTANWEEVCESGWARVFNRDYTHDLSLNRLRRWARSEKPWIAIYVHPGDRWEQRQYERFHTYAQALAFIRGEA